MTFCLSLAVAWSAVGIEMAAAGEGSPSKLVWKSTRPGSSQTSISQSAPVIAPQAAAPRPLAPQTLDIDPDARPIAATKPVSVEIDPFSDPFGDNEISAKSAENSHKAEQAEQAKPDLKQDKSDAQPAGATKKELPWRDPGVIQVNATLPVQASPEKKSALKSTALSWIRPKTPGDGHAARAGDKLKANEDEPGLLDVDESSAEELRSKILPVVNQEPVTPGGRPTLEGELAKEQRNALDPCPPDSERPAPIQKIRSDIRPYVRDKDNKGTDVLDTREVPQECPLGNETFKQRNWSCTNYTWKASGLCHKPLYFEQPHLERYGHTFGGPVLSPIVQPAISTAHFFGSALLLPYKAGMDLPWECQYPLGYYRPGNCAPYSIGPFPLSARGLATEAGVVVGLIFLIP